MIVDWLKEKWEWIIGGLIVLIGFLASRKTNSKVKEKDLEVRLKTEKSIQESQESIRLQSEKDEKDILANHEKEKDLIEFEKDNRVKELKDSEEKIEKYLKDKGITKV